MSSLFELLKTLPRSPHREHGVKYADTYSPQLGRPCEDRPKIVRCDECCKVGAATAVESTVPKWSVKAEWLFDFKSFCPCTAKCFAWRREAIRWTEVARLGFIKTGRKAKVAGGPQPRRLRSLWHAFHAEVPYHTLQDELLGSLLPQLCSNEIVNVCDVSARVQIAWPLDAEVVRWPPGRRL